LSRNYPTFYETGRFITAFRSAHPEPDQASPYPSHVLKINFNIILPSTSLSPKWPLSLRSQHQKPSMHLSVSLTCHIPRPSLYSCVNIWRGVEIVKLLSCNFLHFSVTSSLLRPNIILSTLFCNTFGLCFSFSVKDQVPHP